MSLLRSSFSAACAALIVLGPTRVCAHVVNTDVGEFYAGVLHPLTSAEHWLPMLGIALLAGRSGIRTARWTVLVFPLALMAGVFAGNSGYHMSFIQPLSLVILIGLGVVLALNRPLPLPAVLLAAASLGVLLGYRSGLDMVGAGVNVQFVPGVGLTGLVVIAVGSAWLTSVRSSAMGIGLRLVGCGLVIVGAYLLIVIDWAHYADAARGILLPTEESLVALVKQGKLSASAIAGAFLLAVVWGAAHALTPGHGKAIVAAYLVGTRGTAMHALYLGLTVTATHTLGILALGLVALFASRYLLPEQLIPWLAAVSGAIVVAIGISMLIRRVRILGDPHAHHPPVPSDHHHHHTDTGEAHHHSDHHHGHSHLPETDGADVTWRSLLGLGISGGLLPCPSALVLLLAAVSLQRIGLGLLMVVAFSLGLAGVLTMVGLLFVRGSQLLQDTPLMGAVSRYVPALGAAVIVVVGAVITGNALSRIAL